MSETPRDVVTETAEAIKRELGQLRQLMQGPKASDYEDELRKTIANLGTAFLELGEAEKARPLAERKAGFFEKMLSEVRAEQNALPLDDGEARLREVEVVLGSVVAACRQAIAEGRTPNEQALGEALSIQGYAYWQEGRAEAARDALVEAAGIFRCLRDSERRSDRKPVLELLLLAASDGLSRYSRNSIGTRKGLKQRPVGSKYTAVSSVSEL